MKERSDHYMKAEMLASQFAILEEPKRRWGFHGASHRYIAGRTAELLGRERPADHLLSPGRIQLALRHPQRPQRGHQHGHEPAKRPAAEQPLRRFRPLRPAAGHGADRQVAGRSARHAGQPERPAGPERRQRRLPRHRAGGRGRATPGRKLALDVYAAAVRHYLGAYLVELGGADAIVFTGGIGENRAECCAPPSAAAWRSWASCWTPAANARAQGEAPISAPASRVQIWVVPTNEELVVARQAAQLLKGE